MEQLIRQELLHIQSLIPLMSVMLTNAYAGKI